MKITVLGSTGNAGRRVVAEALSRGHEVTAVVRNSVSSNDLPATAKFLVGDVGNVADVVKVSQKVKVTVLDVDMDRKRISLSMKSAPGKRAEQKKSRPSNISPKMPVKKQSKDKNKPFNNPFADLLGKI